MKTLTKNQRPWVLLNPGPVNVTNRVRQALLKPDICHREQEFSQLLNSVRQKILRIFGITKTHSVAVFSGSGTTALEAMLSSFARPNRKILVLTNGVYGERMKTILEIHETPADVLSSELGGFPDLKKIEKLLQNEPSIHAVAMVHHETSTGMLNPLKEVGNLTKKYRKKFLVDAISSLGAEKIDFHGFSIDALCGTSGKCLHGLPGSSFVIISKKALQDLKGQKPKSLYLDLYATLESEDKGETPFTPAVQIFYAFHEALDELSKEGLSKRIQRYAQKSELLERGFMNLNFNFLVEKKYRSHVLTALWVPSNTSYDRLHDGLKKDGFVIYAGQSKLKGKIFRVSNLGDVSLSDLKRFLVSLRKILKSHEKKTTLHP